MHTRSCHQRGPRPERALLLPSERRRRENGNRRPAFLVWGPGDKPHPVQAPRAEGIGTAQGVAQPLETKQLMRFSEVAQHILVEMERVGCERWDGLALKQGEVVQLCWLTMIKHTTIVLFKFGILSVNYLFILIKSKNA